MQDIHFIPETGVFQPHASTSAWSLHVREEADGPIMIATKPKGGFYSVKASIVDETMVVRISEVASGLSVSVSPLVGGGLGCDVRRTEVQRDASKPGTPIVAVHNSEEQHRFGPRGEPEHATSVAASWKADGRRVVVELHDGPVAALELVMTFPDGCLRVDVTATETVSVMINDAAGIVLEGAGRKVEISDPDPLGRRRNVA
jgi:hypothetical protein